MTIPRATRESTIRLLAADKSSRAKWSHVRFRDNREPSTRALPPHCGGCWCGGENGHDWAGKADGAPHPRSDA